MEFKKLFENIVIDYFNTFNISPISINYSIVDEMTNEYIKLRPDHAQKEPEKIASLNRYNGLTVPPYRVNEKFTVLINKYYIEESLKNGNMNWIGTIAHETTHVRDFTEYAALLNASNYENIIDLSQNVMFQFWTEFNVRAKGYYFLRKYTFENMFDESQISYIINIEIPRQNKWLLQEYRTAHDLTQQMYWISNYLGRLYTLQQIFPKVFTNEEIKNLIPLDQWVYEFFLFLQSHTILEEAYKHFDDMKKIIIFDRQ